MLVLALPARAEITRIGPFSIDSEEPQIIHLAGDIEPAAAAAFRSAMERFPDVTVLTLDSNGGATFVAAAIGAEVSRHGLSTAVLEGDGCFSACPLIFFAGENRLALGTIGVHQVSFPRGSPLDAEDVQLGVARYLEVLVGLDLHPEVILAAVGTPPDEMYVFSRAEVDAWRVEREPQAVRDALGLGELPDRETAIAEVAAAFGALLADDGALRVRVEADVGPMSDEIWAALRTTLRATLLHPASGERILDGLEAQGTSVGALLAGDDAALSDFLSILETNLSNAGFLRLPVADQEWYLGYARAAYGWIAAERPEVCTDPQMLEDPALTVGFVASLDESQRKDYVAHMLRAIEAELTLREPDSTVNDTRMFAAENAVAEAMAVIADDHPRGDEILTPGAEQPFDFCLLTELTLDAIDSLPADLRADAMLLMFQPVPYR